MREHLRQNVVGYIALFCFVIGGTAVALPGKNKVDSGDIKKGQVKRSDVGLNAIDSSKVAPDSLTGEDVNEGSLNLPAPPATLPPSGPAGGDLSGEYPNPDLGAGTVGEAETADRQRRIVISPAAMHPTSAALSSSSSWPVINYAVDIDQNAFAIAGVPTDRVPGSDLQVRLIWSANGTGTAVWEVARQVSDVDEDMQSGIVIATPSTASTVANTLVATSIDLPGGAIQNGELLGLRVTRDADNPAETLTVIARLHAVEIRYTATG